MSTLNTIATHDVDHMPTDFQFSLMETGGKNC
uniref:Uncharacterized protein n=1 Tax=Arundo donax TaxID=35708 RepID=A0A0A9FAP7_ARUDO